MASIADKPGCYFKPERCISLELSADVNRDKRIAAAVDGMVFLRLMFNISSALANLC